MRWLVTGGAGFIGSCFVRTAVKRRWADDVVVLDALTYAGNANNLSAIDGAPGWSLKRGDIRHRADIVRAIGEGIDTVFHFAAESHVDRSIAGAGAFVDTNALGTQILLDVCRHHRVRRFVHISTDEVYGSLPLESQSRFTEQTPLAPTSPYAASKAASDLLVLAAARTHGLDAVVTRCSNNYGPYQHPEKFIPLFITRALSGETLPLYGDGRNVRDWIHVEDHVEGVYLAWQRGKAGAVYNLGGNCERSNREVAARIMSLTGAHEAQIQTVADRLAHDRRYAIDASHARRELGFQPGPSLDVRLPEVVAWYQQHQTWWQEACAGSASSAPFAATSRRSANSAQAASNS